MPQIIPKQRVQGQQVFSSGGMRIGQTLSKTVAPVASQINQNRVALEEFKVKETQRRQGNEAVDAMLSKMSSREQAEIDIRANYEPEDYLDQLTKWEDTHNSKLLDGKSPFFTDAFNQADKTNRIRGLSSMGTAMRSDRLSREDSDFRLAMSKATDNDMALIVMNNAISHGVLKEKIIRDEYDKQIKINDKQAIDDILQVEGPRSLIYKVTEGTDPLFKDMNTDDKQLYLDKARRVISSNNALIEFGKTDYIIKIGHRLNDVDDRISAEALRDKEVSNPESWEFHEWTKHIKSKFPPEVENTFRAQEADSNLPINEQIEHAKNGTGIYSGRTTLQNNESIKRLLNTKKLNQELSDLGREDRIKSIKKQVENTKTREEADIFLKSLDSEQDQKVAQDIIDNIYPAVEKLDKEALNARRRVNYEKTSSMVTADIASLNSLTGRADDTATKGTNEKFSILNEKDIETLKNRAAKLSAHTNRIIKMRKDGDISELHYVTMQSDIMVALAFGETLLNANVDPGYKMGDPALMAIARFGGKVLNESVASIVTRNLKLVDVPGKGSFGFTADESFIYKSYVLNELNKLEEAYTLTGDIPALNKIVYGIQDAGLEEVARQSKNTNNKDVINKTVESFRDQSQTPVKVDVQKFAQTAISYFKSENEEASLEDAKEVLSRYGYSQEAIDTYAPMIVEGTKGLSSTYFPEDEVNDAEAIIDVTDNDVPPSGMLSYDYTSDNPDNSVTEDTKLGTKSIDEMLNNRPNKDSGLTTIDEKISDKVLSKAGETNSINFPNGIRRSSGKKVKAGITIGGLDLTYGGDQIDEIVKRAGLTNEEAELINKYKGFKSSEMSSKEAKSKLSEAEGDLKPMLGRIRKALIEYNFDKVFSRVGVEGNYKTVDEIPYFSNMTDVQKAIFSGMRIKNHKVDFIASDKKVKTLKDFIKLTRSSMKNFNDVDKGAYNEYLKQLEESIA